MSFDGVSGSDSSAIERNRVTSWGGSILGFRGKEEMGGGLNALFQIESNIAGDKGGSPLARRTTFVGLQSDWGTVRLGRRISVVDDLFSVFADNTKRNPVLTSSTLWGQSGVSIENGGFTDHLSNAIWYETPTWNGLRGIVSYATAEEDYQAYNLNSALFYKQGNWHAAASYVYQHNYRYALGNATARGNNDWETTLTAKYNFGVVALSGVYEHIEYELNNGKDTLKRDFFGVGAAVPVGAYTVYGFYGYADDGRGSSSAHVGDVRGGKDTGAQQYTVAVNYPFSKRTLVYAGYMYLKNEARANYTFFRDGNRPTPMGPSNVKPGTDQQGVAVGMYHSF